MSWGESEQLPIPEATTGFPEQLLQKLRTDDASLPSSDAS